VKISRDFFEKNKSAKFSVKMNLRMIRAMRGAALFHTALVCMPVLANDSPIGSKQDDDITATNLNFSFEVDQDAEVSEVHQDGVHQDVNEVHQDEVDRESQGADSISQVNKIQGDTASHKQDSGSNSRSLRALEENSENSERSNVVTAKARALEENSQEENSQKSHLVTAKARQGGFRYATSVTISALCVKLHQFRRTKFLTGNRNVHVYFYDFIA
jgi:hypothetical protein